MSATTVTLSDYRNGERPWQACCTITHRGEYVKTEQVPTFMVLAVNEADAINRAMRVLDTARYAPEGFRHVIHAAVCPWDGAL